MDNRNKHEGHMQTDNISSQRLRGRVALVSGGGSGIGRAAALAYAREGAAVVVAGRRQREIDETTALITATGGEAAAVVADVADSDEVKALVQATIDRFGRLDAAFNNAGIEGKMIPITEQSEADFDEVVRVNLRGVWLAMKYEIGAMIALGNGGSIVNTSSFVARAGQAGASIYAASKGGLEAMVRALAVEVGPKQIRVNNVLPGAIKTPMFDRLGGEEATATVVRFTPLGRLGEPADVGDVAVWLSTDESRFITGQSLLVDGGIAIPGIR
jgi:NAD(P)-dependent dehydrogenase (short-subunit alcohol dehydrogenase family)